MKSIIHTLFFLSLVNFSMAQTIIPLYADNIPNSKPAPNEEVTEVKDGIMRISKISIPTLTIFLPPTDKANGTAVVICPGGGYWINASSHEGTDVAKKFNEMGVTAFVVKYRIPNDATMPNKEIGPLQDAQQAMKIVRERAKEWNINPDRIGIMGFSAGGHLASTAGTHFNSVVIPNEKNTSVRPDFMILIYPVISFQESITHMGSRDQLIGKQPPAEKIKLYSNELQVTSQTPPTFLVHASDDGAVQSENSIVFYQALLKNNVGAEMHLYQKGGHGFGMVNKTTDQLWMEDCKSWLKSNGWL
ncbi:MAG TPA: alpha/beta hydrolase [Chryseolinea sp.]|nr:alpha/beta hydrolase [Chryseolinea sp.]